MRRRGSLEDPLFRDFRPHAEHSLVSGINITYNHLTYAAVCVTTDHGPWKNTYLSAYLPPFVVDYMIWFLMVPGLGIPE